MNVMTVLGGSPCTAGTPTCTAHKAAVDLNRVSNTTGAALTHPHPQSSRYPPRCPSVAVWTPCSGVEWRVFEPTIRVWRSGTTRKQPVNLAVEAAEESLSILPDYTPTVRPPPKRS